MDKKNALHEIELATTASIWKRPDSIIEQRPGWFQITTPSSKQFWMNGVVQSILTGDEAEAKVIETIAHYEKLGSRFRWRLSPSSRPKNLAQLLEKHGMRDDHAGFGMAAEARRLKITVPSEITVERVTLANVEEYVAASAAGWGNTKEAASEILQDMRRSLADPSHGTLYFLARCNGIPAASGGLILLERSGYFLGSSVVPAFRGHGAYRALVATRAQELRDRGIQLATIHAMAATSAPICARLGFETICEVQTYLSHERT